MEQPIKDTVVEAVREDLLSRSERGILKYNTTLKFNDKDNYLNHLYEEILDSANYCKKLIMQKEDITDLVKQYPNDQELGVKIRSIYGN